MGGGSGAVIGRPGSSPGRPGEGWEFGLLWSLTEALCGMSPDSSLDFPQPGLVASSPNSSCYHFPLLVSSSSSRVDLFNGLLGPVQVTALHVTCLDNVTVAHMGTTDGRILQVGPSPSQPFVPASPSPSPSPSSFCSQLTCPRWSWPGLSTTCCMCPTSH